MNGSDALDAPLFLQSDEDRLKKEQEERWARTLAWATNIGAKNAHSSDDGCAKLYIGPPRIRLSDRQAAVYAILRDGLWHATSEFLGPKVGGSEGMRRLRELKMKGFRIERRKIKGSSQWEYRLDAGESEMK